MIRADEELSQLETVLAFFATFVLDSELVQQIMRWDKAVLTESPWYQEILREGEKLGEQRGEQRGKELGRIEMILEVKFSTGGLNLMPEITEIDDLEQLKAIQHGIMALNTLGEVRRFIESLKSVYLQQFSLI
ncbi:MAG: hypothetical protein KME64_37935 [Scytonematopsis contorta HA4267-MV1]|jgi:predicted transposase YdaD|nr:hypothetical protein [Scytonematopsis contorta HA4267-MV1]